MVYYIKVCNDIIVVVICGVLVVGVYFVLFYGLGIFRDRWFILVCSFLVEEIFILFINL